MAVLFRAGYMSADLEIELTNRKIPFEKWGGLKFLEAAHVKDVLAFLRILENPRDEVSWYRILLLLPGIGDATARAAIELMAQRAWDSARVRAAISRRRERPRGARRTRRSFSISCASTPLARRGDRVAADIARVRQLYDNILRETYDRRRAAARRSRSAADDRRRLSRAARRFSPRSRSSRRRRRRISPAAVGRGR